MCKTSDLTNWIDKFNLSSRSYSETKESLVGMSGHLVCFGKAVVTNQWLLLDVSVISCLLLRDLRVIRGHCHLKSTSCDGFSGSLTFYYVLMLWLRSKAKTPEMIAVTDVLQKPLLSAPVCRALLFVLILFVCYIRCQQYLNHQQLF